MLHTATITNFVPRTQPSTDEPFISLLSEYHRARREKALAVAAHRRAENRMYTDPAWPEEGRCAVRFVGRHSYWTAEFYCDALRAWFGRCSRFHDSELAVHGEIKAARLATVDKLVADFEAEIENRRQTVKRLELKYGVPRAWTRWRRSSEAYTRIKTRIKRTPTTSPLVAYAKLFIHCVDECRHWRGRDITAAGTIAACNELAGVLEQPKVPRRAASS